MSPKDLKTIHFLNKMLDAGVSVLKIEGRARSAEYVYTVVECYREAVQAYFDDEFTDEKVADWDLRLSSVFNRGFWDGYYLGQHLGEWSKNYGSLASHRKLYVGKGLNYFSNLKVAEFKLETGPLRVGDEIYITGPTTGLVKTTVTEIQLDKQSVTEAPKGSYISIPVDTKIRKSDKLYKIVEASEVKQQ
jgi:putative protease